MESSIATFLLRWSACELLPTMKSQDVFLSNSYPVARHPHFYIVAAFDPTLVDGQRLREGHQMATVQRPAASDRQHQPKAVAGAWFGRGRRCLAPRKDHLRTTRCKDSRDIADLARSLAIASTTICVKTAY